MGYTMVYMLHEHYGVVGKPKITIVVSQQHLLKHLIANTDKIES